MEPNTLKSSRSATFDWLRVWPLWLAALWWGSLTALGSWVVPTLFAQMPSKVLAGNAAAALFGVQSMVTVILGGGLLLATQGGAGGASRAGAHAARGFVLAGMVSALLLEFAVAPRIVMRIDLPLWHAVGTFLLLLQWVCAAVVLWRLARPTA